VKHARARLHAFWFQPTSTNPVAFLRIAFGVLVCCWTASAFQDRAWFYGRGAVVGPQPASAGPLGFLGWFDGSAMATTAATVTLVLLGAAALCLTVGLWARLAGWVVFVCILALHQRNPYVLNGGDLLLRTLAFYVALAPTGAALSVDRWRRHRSRFWEAPLRAPWAMRLVQLQVCVMYFDSVWEKLPGETWRGGTAVSWALANDSLARVPGGGWLSDHVVLTNLATYGTLVIEVALVFLVWNRKARPWVLLGGVALHLGIEVGMPLGFFPAVVMVSYLSFVTPEAADALVAWLHRPRAVRTEQRIRA